MNVKKYMSFIAIALIAFVALFGVIPQQSFAQTEPANGWFLRSASWCGPCNQLASKLGVSYANLPSALGNSVTYLNADQFPAPPGLGNGIPRLYKMENGKVVEQLPGAGQEVVDKINEIKNQLPDQPKQQDEKICIVPRPGQDEKYGPITDNPAIYQPLYPIQDTSATHPVIAGHIADEAEINFKLRKLGSKTMREHREQLEKQPREGATKKIIEPNHQQAEEYIQSMGGNPNAQGSYKIDGTDVPVGEYRANQQDQRTGITFDKNCENPKKTGPAPDPGKTPPGGAAPGFGDLGNGGGGGGGFGGGGGGLGGGAGALGALGPLLQGLMGGGQGQQGQGQGQNPYGAGYGNGQPICETEAIAPVCGTDGKTYKNSCYAQQLGVVVRSTGVCTQANPSVSPIPNINSIVTLAQLAQSGVPAELLENVRNLVTSVLSSILAGTNVTETRVP